MFVRVVSVLLPAALLLAAGGGASAQSSLRRVAVEGYSVAGKKTEGVGILRPRNVGECFVVAPRHVADPDSGGALAIGFPASRDALAPVPERYSTDLAVWRMGRQVDRSNCPAWPSVIDVNRTLERAVRRGAGAYVFPWTEQGPGKAVEVTLDQLTLTRFIIRHAGDALVEGMSGSPVQVDGMVVGILTEVSTEEHYGVVLRLDYLERHVGPFFNPSPSPDHAAIYASVLLPGMGQAKTRRVQSGLFWLGVGAGASASLFLHTRNEQVARTRTLPDGREETYFETRPSNPHRRYSWVPWLAAGLGSFLEARTHASRHYIPPERSGADRGRGARVRLRPDVRSGADGATRVQVGEVRF